MCGVFVWLAGSFRARDRRCPSQIAFWGCRKKSRGVINVRPSLPLRCNDFSRHATGASSREVGVKPTVYLAALGFPPAQDLDLMTDIAK